MYKTTRRRSLGGGTLMQMAPRTKMPLMSGAMEALLREQGADMMQAQSEVNALAQTATGVDVPPVCGCLVDNLVSFAGQQGMTVDAASTQAMYDACAVDPSEFKRLVASQGVNLEACKPWYKRKKTVMAGGAVLAGLLLWRFL